MSELPFKIQRTGAQLRDEAMARVERAAPQHWKDMAYKAVLVLAARDAVFTTDEVWAKLKQWGVEPPPERRAMGPIITSLVRTGVIDLVGFTTSNRPERHNGPIRQYQGSRTPSQHTK